MPSVPQALRVRVQSLLKPKCQVTADWLREHPQAQKKVIRPAATFRVPGSPVHCEVPFESLGYGAQGVSRMPLPDRARQEAAHTLGVHHPGCIPLEEWPQAYDEPVQEAAVLTLPLGRVARNGIVITPDRTVLLDLHPFTKAGDPVHRILRGGNFLRLRPVRRFAGRLGVVSAKTDHNYFHWLMDSLPRLALLRDEKVDAFFLNTENAFQREAYKLLGIPESKIVTAGGKHHWYADELVAPTLPNAPLHTPPWAVDFLRSMRDRALGTLPQAGRKLYLSRADADNRKVANEDELVAALAARGFTKVTLQGMPFIEQMRLFASASEVVAIHGAGMCNLAFSPPGVKVVELAPTQWIESCFRIVCASSGHRHAMVVSPAPQNGHRLDQVVDPRHVLHALDQIG